MELTCLLIGEDSLLIHCGKLLLEKQYSISCVVSAEKSIQFWCDTNNIPWIYSIEQYSLEEESRVDYLFSIVNGIILSKQHLQIARMGAINYHDSLLPRYAGLNATTWAIINNEKIHGITWHSINEVIDKGDILHQRTFPIFENDTVLTLNLRCFEEAINGFSQVINQIETSTLKLKKQNTEGHSYYAINHVLPNLGFIDWRNYSAIEIDRLCRALNFGHYNNHIGTLKIYLNDTYLIVSDIKISSKTSKSDLSGLVLSIDSDGISISTMSQPIIIKVFISPSGNDLSIDEVVRNYGISIGQQLPNFDFSLKKNCHHIYETALNNEQYWIKQLNAISEHNLFSKRYFKANSNYKSLPPINLKHFTHKSIDQSQYYLLACVLIYLYRLNDYENITVFLTHSLLNDCSYQCSGLFSSLLPIIFDFSDATTPSSIIENVIQKLNLLPTYGTFLSDIFVRDPYLEPINNQSAITIGLSTIENKLPENSIIHFAINNNLNELVIYHQLDSTYQGYELTPIISNMADHLANILHWIIYNSDQSIQNFCFLSPKEKKQIISYGTGELRLLPGESINELFEQQVKNSPDSPAIFFDNSVLTYYMLWEKAEKIASFIRSLELPIHTPIGIYINRSSEMLILILGILKADCVYVPLDLKYPILKIEIIINESKLGHIFSIEHYIDRLKLHISNDLYWYDIAQILTNTIDIDNNYIQSKNKTKNKLAYIMFTSGTTGTPKGVMISQKNIINYCYWFTQTTQFDSKSIIDFSSSLAFDLSVPCTLAPLLAGGSLAICSDQQKINPQLYLEHLQSHKITHTELTSGYIEILLHYPDEIRKLKELHYLLLGADMVHTEEVTKWLTLCPSSQVINEYGPTETTVAITSYFVKKLDDLKEALVPIGRPGFNSTCYLFDKYMNLCPLGMKGELYVGGDQVALGYFGKPELTAQKFITTSQIIENGVYYKTGDLACWLPSGYLQFFGRNDDQVKIQGYRIELPAIESILLKHQSINQAVVVIRQDKLKQRYLRAYLVSEDQLLTCKKIINFLGLYLPSYMHPKEFYVVSSIPLMENEKIDCNSLEIQSNKPLTFNSEPIVFDLTNTQDVCLCVWQTIFRSNEISIEDDFFRIGGDSLVALQIICSLKKQFKIEISLSILFEYPTITLLANRIDDLLNKETLLINYKLQHTSITKLSSGTYETPLFLVHPVGGSIFWYQQLAQRLKGKYTIYGIEDQTIVGNGPRFSSLPEMAHFYLDEISKVYDGDNYCIGGASFGATVAVEIAKQLMKANKNIKFLGLFDGWAKYPETLMEHNTINVLMQHKQEIEHQTSSYLQELEAYRKKLLLQYELPIIDTDVTLFKAQELWDSFVSIDDPHNGWRPYIGGNIIVHKTPGTHETMFFAPNVGVLANLIILETHEN